MKIKNSLILLSALTAITLTGCNQPQSSEDTDDTNDHVVEINDPIDTIVPPTKPTVVSTESHDVVVYGATSAGITAAIAAKRECADVVLLCATNHVGAMTASGVNLVDMADYNCIGGLSKTFFQKVYEYYMDESNWHWQNSAEYLGTNGWFGGKNDALQMMWMVESCAAEQIYLEMLEEAGVPVIYNAPIDLNYGVNMDSSNTFIESIMTTDGRVYKGRTFIDASFEGDLMAQAHVTYTYGREDREQYDEKYNGIRFAERESMKCSPYLLEGDEESGLLPFVEDKAPGTTGQADKRLQSYGYRFTLSNNPSNMVEISKPEEYHPEWYEMHVRALQNGYRNKWKDTYLCYDPIPNAKVDVNQADLPGLPHDYLNASYEQRAEIERIQRNYTEGMMYFLQTDTRLPASVREKANSYGWAKDDFVDNNNFPYSIYVREGRRMISDYVMTEHNVLNTSENNGGVDAPYSIGQGMYNADSHNCSYFSYNGSLYMEGGYWSNTRRNYPISYLSIIPKKGETVNLFVPCCVSASHGAISSIRVEPTYMILGESSGIAAALVAKSSENVEDQISSHDLDYFELKDKLVENGQLLGSIVFPEKEGTYIFDTYDEKFQAIGEIASSSTLKFNGKPIRVTNVKDTGGCWTLNDIEEGKYELSLYNFYNADYDDADYLVTITDKDNQVTEITFAGGEHELETFVTIGTFTNIASVSIKKTHENGTKAYIRFAAIRLVPITDNFAAINNRKTSSTNDEIVVSDPNLRQLIIDTLGISNNHITKQDMCRLKKLDTPNNNPESKIKTLKGLEYAVNLEELNIDYNSIKSVKYIKDLTKLKKLDISYNPIVDISCLNNLTNLEEFKAISTGYTISDYSVIENFTKLKLLNLSICKLTSANFLTNLTHLTKAYLIFNHFSDTEAIKGLTSALLYF